MVAVEAGDVRGDLEAAGAGLLVEREVARGAGPLEDALRRLADERLGVLPGEAAVALGLLDERAGAVAEDLALRERRLDARAWRRRSSRSAAAR